MAVCYRHPGRETNVACSNCERPICTDCMTPTPVGMRCPECARQRTRVVRGTGSGLTWGTVSTAPATYALIALNVAAFLAEVAGGGGAASLNGGGEVIRRGGLNGPDVANGEVYRIVTAAFLHAGPLHILLNMVALYFLGRLVEPAIGTARFLGIYAVSLLAGAFGALLLTPDTNTVGASGAIFGLLSAAFLLARHRGLEQLASQIGFYVILNLLFTLGVPGISIGGHIGGLIGGALATFVVIAGERRHRPAAEALALLGLGILSIVGCLAAASAA